MILIFHNHGGIKKIKWNVQYGLTQLMTCKQMLLLMDYIIFQKIEIK